MSNVVPIARERVEVGRVTGNGERDWMMLVMDGDEIVDLGFYLTKNAATTAAKTWELPIRYFAGIATVTAETAPAPRRAGRIRYRAGRPAPALRHDRVPPR